MKELPVYNLTFSDPGLYGEFTVEEGYKFTPTNPLNVRGNPREITETHTVSFALPDVETLIWRERFVPGGKAGERGQRWDPQVRGHIEDIIILLGFLNSTQVALGGDWKDMPDFPSYARGSMPPFSGSAREIQQNMHHCLKKLHDREWMTKFRNFFPIIHFTNGEKITTSEPKFISHIVIWEQVFSLIHGDSEKIGLNQIISKLLGDFFGCSLEFSRKNPCVFFIIRNQFIHNGLWPISGPRLEYTPDSLKKMGFEASERYLRFFGRLTYALLLRILDFDLSLIKQRLTDNRNWYDESRFAPEFDEFIATGLVESYSAAE